MAIIYYNYYVRSSIMSPNFIILYIVWSICKTLSVKPRNEKDFTL